jgi:hypothetical protein
VHSKRTWSVTQKCGKLSSMRTEAKMNCQRIPLKAVVEWKSANDVCVRFWSKLIYCKIREQAFFFGFWKKKKKREQISMWEGVIQDRLATRAPIKIRSSRHPSVFACLNRSRPWTTAGECIRTAGIMTVCGTPFSVLYWVLVKPRRSQNWWLCDHFFTQASLVGREPQPPF